ncbi:MAG: polymerase sigma-70 factor, subfamily [Clostridiales bacterium]|nr:polymerase sigma-70 factor, subfamily [Clostridiales bacterium]
MKEEELVRVLLEDPEEGVKEAIDKYGDTVYWIITKILGNSNQMDIEECVSDVFARLWRGISRFEAERGVSLSSYIYGITRHVALDFKRARKELEEIPLEENEVSFLIDYEDQFTKKQNNRKIQQVIDELSEPMRDIFIYRYYFRYSIKDIACKLHLKPKKVENILYRGKDIIKERLLKEGVIL